MHSQPSFNSTGLSFVSCVRFAVHYLAVHSVLRKFALIVSGHHYCAHKFTCYVIQRARALTTKMNNDRADGHCEIATFCLFERT